MKWQIHNLYGFLHTLTGMIAVISAIIILFSKKGTVLHKRMGYAYIVSMLVLNISAWGVMEFFPGKPGPFHFGSLISLIFIFLGMYPVVRRRHYWLQKHYNFINGSVIGLFAAFFVEVAFRSFSDAAVIIGFTFGTSLLVTIIGAILIVRNRPKILPGSKISG